MKPKRILCLVAILLVLLLAALPWIHHAINAKDDHGRTPLHLAAAGGDTGKVERLLALGADVNARNKDGQTPLHMVMGPVNTAAEMKSKTEVAAILLSHGAEVNAKDATGQTPLHLAALFCLGHPDMVELLLAHGADVNARENRGWTPLYEAVVGYSPIDLLLAHGADVNAKTNDGQTPLHMAANEDLKGMAEDLLAHGAEVNVKDNQGFTPLHYAVEFSYVDESHKDVAELLRQHGGHE